MDGKSGCSIQVVKLYWDFSNPQPFHKGVGLELSRHL